ncbi:methyltransferase domain-containing protein [Branchiibius sp. NY16-3462-2]|uniref:methyltransferase domain-containing protein n=1 Tax=Branchiibius sp. NY16-3462-2 TaxID=1807500 RepID=UPI0025BF4043|nr:methyltransferase domain-containing protein [Branchiibius sp. NY16-3462-2]
MCEICGGPTAPWILDPDNRLIRCTACGHLTRNLTDAPAHHRAAAYGGEPHLDRLRLLLTHRLLQQACPDAPTSVFEIGYGSGQLLRSFADVGAKVGGADPDQLDVAVDPVVAAGGGLHPVAVEDLGQQVVEQTAADLVFGIHVVEHVRDPARTMQVAAQLARPGGTLAFLTPAGDSDGLTRWGSNWWMLEDPTHVRFFTANSLTHLAQDAGLEQVQVHRPRLDSLVTDAASAARRRGTGPDGALASRAVLARAALSAPWVLARRTVQPLSRPSLLLVARRPV